MASHGHVAGQQVPRDRAALDLVGALVDAQHPQLAVPPLDRQLTAVQPAALAAPARWTYSDLASAPPQQDEIERLSLNQETPGGEAALARKRRDDAIRSSGHADQPAIAAPAE